METNNHYEKNLLNWPGIRVSNFEKRIESMWPTDLIMIRYDCTWRLVSSAIPSSSNLLSQIFPFLDRQRMLYCSLHDSDGSILLRFMIADTLTNYSNFRLWHRWLYSQTSNYKIHRWYNRVFFLFFLSLPVNI
jgi:hypothetical protein